LLLTVEVAGELLGAGLPRLVTPGVIHAPPELPEVVDVGGEEGPDTDREEQPDHQTTAGIGVTSRVGFRVLELTNPTRIVIDLAHPQVIDDGGLSGGPRALTVTPNSGPVGAEVIVEGQGCGRLDEPVRLVLQSGSTGTVGAVDLGEFPVSEQDAFRATSVVIPARMDPLQGIGRRSDPTWHLPVQHQAADLHRDFHGDQ
jgi:hypothetical protein